MDDLLNTLLDERNLDKIRALSKRKKEFLYQVARAYREKNQKITETIEKCCEIYGPYYDIRGEIAKARKVGISNIEFTQQDSMSSLYQIILDQRKNR